MRSRRRPESALDASVNNRSLASRSGTQLFAEGGLAPQDGNAVVYVVNDSGAVLGFKSP